MKNMRGAQKGQATIEFLLILLLAVGYIMAVVQPNADYASNSIADVASIGKLSVSAQKLSNAVQYVSLSGKGTRQTVEIVVPADGKLECDTGSSPDSVKFSYTLKSGRGIAACEGDIDVDGKMCTRLISVGTDFTCDFLPVTSPLTTSAGPGIYSTAIEKDSGTGAVEATFTVVQ